VLGAQTLQGGGLVPAALDEPLQLQLPRAPRYRFGAATREQSHLDLADLPEQAQPEAVRRAKPLPLLAGSAQEQGPVRQDAVNVEDQHADRHLTRPP